MATQTNIGHAPAEAGSFSTKYQRLVDYAGLADFLGISVRNCRRLVAKGRIDRIKVGHSAIRFDLEDVLRRLKQGV